MLIELIKKENFIAGPSRSHYNDAGADVASTIDILVPPHSTVKIPLGYGIKLPDGIMAIVQPRSGMSSMGIFTQVAPIDSGYTGEIHAILSNLNAQPFHVTVGMRVGQIVVLPIVLPQFVAPDEMGGNRGDAGFGSTGTE